MVLPCFRERGNIVAASCTMYSSLIIVKSLQLRGRRKIAEPRKYCLVRVIVFSLTCVFSICFVSHRLEFWLNFPTTGIRARFRFKWEQWQRKQERRLE